MLAAGSERITGIMIRGERSTRSRSTPPIITRWEPQTPTRIRMAVPAHLLCNWELSPTRTEEMAKLAAELRSVLGSLPSREPPGSLKVRATFFPGNECWYEQQGTP